MNESERVLRDLLDVLFKEADPDREWGRLLDIALAEARQQDGSALRIDPLSVQEAGMCPNCVTPWKCNGPHLAALPPSAPPALDVERLAMALEVVMPGVVGSIQLAADIAAEHGRLHPTNDPGERE